MVGKGVTTNGVIVLGIETSCDETSLCLINGREILSMKTFSQVDLHKVYGGVVPEIASRDHLNKISTLFNECIADSGISLADINLIAYTSTPGLVGSLMTGIMFAKALSITLGIKATPVNHLLAHVFTCNISHGIHSNFVCLLISGGHTFIYDVKSVNEFKILGETLDDSIGEVFDKLAKSIGLGYPGGVVIEKIAKFGNENSHKFKIPLNGSNQWNRQYNFSLSGIKTEFLKLIQSTFLSHSVPRGTNVDFILHELESGYGTNYNFSVEIANISASFQKTIVRILTDRLKNCVNDFNLHGKDFVVCGGVASNEYIRNGLVNFCESNGMKFFAPPVELCTDNAAMVANLGYIMDCDNLGS